MDEEKYKELLQENARLAAKLACIEEEIQRYKKDRRVYSLTTVERITKILEEP